MSNVSQFLKLTLYQAFQVLNKRIIAVKLFVLKEIFDLKPQPEFYLSEVKKFEFETGPDYAKIQNKITDSFQLLGHSKSLTDDFFIFAAPKASNKSLTNEKESKIVADDLQDEAERQF